MNFKIPALQCGDFLFLKNNYRDIILIMKTVYIFHDAFSDQYTDWYSWLKNSLGQAGYHVIIPVFPTPAGQSLDSWMMVMKNYIPTFNEDTLFVGHGTGALFALRLLEKSEKQIRGLYTVAGYAEKIGNVGYDRVNETFLTGDFKWETISSRVMTIHVMAGDDDPFVPRETAERLAKNLGVNLEIITGGGHLTKASGFAQFVALASSIREGESVIEKGVEMDVPETIPVSQVLEPVSAPVIPEPVSVPVTEQVTSAAHTMYQDMTKLVNANSGEVASALLSQARTDEKIAAEKSPASPQNIAYLAGSLIVVMLAIISAGYVFRVYLPAQKNQVSPTVPSIITAQNHQNIDMMQSPYAIAEKIRAAVAVPPAANGITDVYYTKGSLRTMFPNVLETLEITTLPATLVTEFGQPMFMHGIMNASGQPAHFLILPVSNYDVAFAGLHEWEPTMFRDLGIFMNVPGSFLKTKTNKDVFKDEMIANRNLRVLRYVKSALINFSETTPTISSSTTPVVKPVGVATTVPAVVGNNATTTDTASPISNFVSEGITAIQNPFVTITAPYHDNDVMLAYFFLNEKTVVVVDNLDIIPELLSRYANRQIYQ